MRRYFPATELCSYETEGILEQITRSTFWKKETEDWRFTWIFKLEKDL